MLRTGPYLEVHFPLLLWSLTQGCFNILPNCLKRMGTNTRLYHKFLKFNHVKMYPYCHRISQTFQVWCQNMMQGWDCDGGNSRWKSESLRGLWIVEHLICCSMLILSPVGGGSARSLSHSVPQEYACDWGHWSSPASGLFGHEHKAWFWLLSCPHVHTIAISLIAFFWPYSVLLTLLLGPNWGKHPSCLRNYHNVHQKRTPEIQRQYPALFCTTYWENRSCEVARFPTWSVWPLGKSSNWT